MKKGILILILLLTASVHAFAQAASLRRGFYKTQGSEDEILVLPDTSFDPAADGFRRRYGYYGMSAWYGPVRNGNLLFAATGTVDGRELLFNVEEANPGMLNEAGGFSITVTEGAVLIFTIIAHEAFRDNTGKRWFWHRDSRGY